MGRRPRVFAVRKRGDQRRMKWLCVALLAAASLALAAEPDTRRSGFDFMSAQTQAMQQDDTRNPAMLWVKQGEALWQRKAGVTDKSCASCHAEVSKSMRGVAARYPAFDALEQRPVSLNERIRLCRQRNQLPLPFAAESHDLLSL